MLKKLTLFNFGPHLTADTFEGRESSIPPRCTQQNRYSTR